MLGKTQCLVGIGAGVIPWPSSYAKYFFRDYTPKSVGLNAPPEVRTASPEEQEAYWEEHPIIYEKYLNGELSRKGNDPLVYLNVENGGFNCMSFPNPGPKAILDEILMDESGVPIRLSIFGQDTHELRQLVSIAKEHPAYSRIKSIEINVSCPNTKCGESCSTSDLEQIKCYIKTVREVTDKELIVKLSPLVDVCDYIETIIESGADAVNISNTVPGRAYNGHTSELLMPVGGVNGPIVYERMLKNVSDTYQRMKKLGDFIPIYASGGITSKGRALEAIMAGATYVDLGYALKDLSEEGIRQKVRGIEDFLASHDLDSLRGLLVIESNPEWWVDEARWHVNPDGSRQLKVVSYDHKPFIVKEVVQLSDNYYKIEFNESFGSHSVGQYLGLMLKLNDRFEERPFTIFDHNSIIIQDVGKTSHGLCNLEQGAMVYVRGPLGNGLPSNLGKTLAIGAGCGSAAIAQLDYEKILAFSKECDAMLQDLDNIIMFHIDERDGGLLPVSEIDFVNYDNLVLCGPKPMMFTAAKAATAQGMNPEDIHLIMESIFKCFNGLCGACDCGGIRLCKTGPVVTYQQLLDIGFLVRDHSGRIV